MEEKELIEKVADIIRSHVRILDPSWPGEAAREIIALVRQEDGEGECDHSIAKRLYTMGQPGTGDWNQYHCGYCPLCGVDLLAKPKSERSDLIENLKGQLNICRNVGCHKLLERCLKALEGEDAE